MAPFFPAFDALYFSLSSQLDVGDLVSANKLWLTQGPQAFKRPSAAAADKLKQRQAVPLDDAPQGYRGVAGKDGMHAQASLAVSEALQLAEGQAVLLVNRWVRDSDEQFAPGWTPNDDQLRAIYAYYVSQRLYLLSCISLLAELAAVSDEDESSTLLASHVPVDEVYQHLTAFACDTITLIGLRLETDGASPSQAQGGLRLSAKLCKLVNLQDQGARELSQALTALLFLARTTLCPAATVLQLTEALGANMLRLAPDVLDDHSSLPALAVRQAQLMLLEGMRCRELMSSMRERVGVQGVLDEMEPLFTSLTPKLSALAQPAAPPSTAPLLLTWAAALQVRGTSEAAAASARLAGAAEGADGLRRLHQLLQHDLLADGRDREVAGRVIFQALSLVASAFDLRLARLPPDSLRTLLELLHDLLGKDAALCEMVWFADNPAGSFVRRLLMDAEEIFPVLPVPFVGLLASLCTGPSACERVMQYLKDMRGFAHHFDADAAALALSVRDSRVTITGRNHPAILQALKVGQVQQAGRLLSVPRCAQDVVTGGVLVQLRLDDGAPARSLGLQLLLQALQLKVAALGSARLRAVRQDEMADLLRDVEVCTRLCARVLTESTLNVYELFEPCAAASELTLCEAVGTTVVNAASQLALTARTHAQPHAACLLSAATHCLAVLAAFAAALPAAVLQLLQAPSPDPTPGGSSLFAAASGPLPWVAVAHASVHSCLEAPAEEYPFTLELLRLARGLVQRLPASGGLLDLVASLTKGVACEHAGWRYKRPADRWALSEAALLLLRECLARDGVMLGGDRADRSAQLAVLHLLCYEGLLPQLLQATMVPDAMALHTSDISVACRTQIDAAVVAFMRFATALIGCAHSLDPRALAVVRGHLFEAGFRGVSPASVVASYQCYPVDPDSTLTFEGLKCIHALALLAADGRGPMLNLAEAISCAPEGGKYFSSKRLREQLLLPFMVTRCLEAPAETETAVELLRTSLRAHGALATFLLFPTDLRDRQAGAVTADNANTPALSSSAAPRLSAGGRSAASLSPPSALDLLFTALRDMADPPPESGDALRSDPHKLVALMRGVTSLLFACDTHAQPCRILTSQPEFWRHMESVASACLRDGEPGAHASARTHIAACALDALAFSAHRDLGRRAQQERPPYLGWLSELLGAGGASASIVRRLRDWPADGTCAGWRAAALRVEALGRAVALQVWVSVASRSVPSQLKPCMHALYRELDGRMPPLTDMLDERFGGGRCYSSHAHQALLRLLAGDDPSDVEGCPQDAMEAATFLLPHLNQSSIHVPILERMQTPPPATPREGIQPHPPPPPPFDPARWPQLLHGLGIEHTELGDEFTVALVDANEAAAATAARLALLRATSHVIAVALSPKHDSLSVGDLLRTDWLIELAQKTRSAWRECDMRVGAAAAAARANAGAELPGPSAASPSLSSRSPGSPRIGPYEMSQPEWSAEGLDLRSAAAASHEAATHWARMLQVCLTRRSSTDDVDDVPRAPSLAGFGGSSEEDSVRQDVNLVCHTLDVAADILARAATIERRLVECGARVPLDAASTELSPQQASAEHSATQQLLECALACMQANQPAIASLVETLSAGAPRRRDGSAARRDADRQGLQGRVMRCAAAAAAAVSQHALHRPHHRAAALSCLLDFAALMAPHFELPQSQTSALLSHVPLETLLKDLVTDVRACGSLARVHAELGACQRPVLVMGLLTQVCSNAAAAALTLQLDVPALALDLAALLCSLPAHPRPAEPQNSDASDASTETAAPSGFGPLYGGTAQAAASRALALAPAAMSWDDAVDSAAGGAPGAATASGAAADGYAAAGHRSLPALLRLKAFQLLGVLLRANGAREDFAASVLVTLEPHLAMPLTRFAALLTASDGPTPHHLTLALVQECLAALFLLAQLQRFRGACLLHLPRWQPTLRGRLAAVLRCVALLPTDLRAVAALSCAPVAPPERRSAAQPPTGASEPLLKMRTAWFWTTASAAGGPTPEADVVVPPWSRWWPERGSRSRSLTASRTPGPQGQRALLRSTSPRSRSPVATLHGPSPQRRSPSSHRRSPSPEPAGSGAMSISDAQFGSTFFAHDASEELDATRHSELLAMGVYDVAHTALSLLMATSGAGSEGASSIAALWPSEDVLFALQRQCLAVASDLEQSEAHKGMGGFGAQRAASKAALVQTASSILALVERIERLSREVKKPTTEGQAQALASSKASLHGILSL